MGHFNGINVTDKDRVFAKRFFEDVDFNIADLTDAEHHAIKHEFWERIDKHKRVANQTRPISHLAKFNVSTTAFNNTTAIFIGFIAFTGFLAWGINKFTAPQQQWDA